MIQAGVGISKHADSENAGRDACQMAMQKAGIEKPDLVIIFASVKFEQEAILKGVRAAAGDALVVGCTDAGEITNNGPSTESVAVMAIASDQITFTTGVGENVKEDARQAGSAVARAVQEKSSEPLRAFVMFPDVLTGNGADIVRGVLDKLGAHFPVVGGAAGDDFRFEKTFEYEGDKVFSGAVTGLGLSGEFTMGAGVRHGWVPIGMPMKVTKSKGAVIYELDGKPAITVYEDYFGEQANEMRKEALAKMAITYPLGLKIPEYQEEYLIRDPITVDENGAITCAAEIPEGSEVRLMIGSTEKAVEAAEDAARRLMETFQEGGKTPKFLLMFNCIAREKLFAQEANKEIEAVLRIVGKDVPLLGFYTYGEQAPLAGEINDPEKCDPRFYNETIVIFAVGE